MRKEIMKVRRTEEGRILRENELIECISRMGKITPEDQM